MLIPFPVEIRVATRLLFPSRVFHLEGKTGLLQWKHPRVSKLLFQKERPMSLNMEEKHQPLHCYISNHWSLASIWDDNDDALLFSLPIKVYYNTFVCTSVCYFFHFIFWLPENPSGKNLKCTCLFAKPHDFKVFILYCTPVYLSQSNRIRIRFYFLRHVMYS